MGRSGRESRCLSLAFSLSPSLSPLSLSLSSLGGVCFAADRKGYLSTLSYHRSLIRLAVSVGDELIFLRITRGEMVRGRVEVLCYVCCAAGLFGGYDGGDDGMTDGREGLVEKGWEIDG